MKRIATLVVCAIALLPGRTLAQDDDSLAAPIDSVAGPSAGGAMLRSIVLPGWGQLATGHPLRAGVFATVHAADIFMVVQTQRRISQAQDIERVRASAARDSILGAAAADTALLNRLESNPDSLDALVAEVPGVHAMRSLIESRKRQREDWIAWGLFWMLASGADAYVNAQLRDFPVHLRTAPRAGGGMWIGADIATRSRR